MQFEQLPGGERVDLPKHSVDTGMGLERVAAVLQGVTDNYDIDLFKALIAASVQATGVAASGEQQGLAPRHRRSLARFELPHRRRRAAVQRGARLRAPPHHAPCHAPRASARRRGAADVPPGTGAGARDGRHLSRAAARPAADHRDAAPGRDAFQEDAREGARPARRSVGQAQEGRRPAGRDGVQALRHLRLPARPHRGCAARARRHCRHQGFRSRHAAAEGGSAQGLEGLRRGGDGIDLVRGEGEDRR